MQHKLFVQTNERKETRFDHSKIGKTIDESLYQIQQTSVHFQRLNRDTYSSIAEEARDLRELADYGVGFEAGGSEIKLAQMLSKVEELVTISDYTINKWIAKNDGKVDLHSSPKQEELPLVEDLIDKEENLLLQSLLIVTPDFNARIFAYKLLSEKNIYYTKFAANCFKAGLFARYSNGSFTRAFRPKRGFVELTKENISKWSDLIKPQKLNDLATANEDEIQKLNIFYYGFYFSLYIFPDGCLYFFTPIDEKGFEQQLSCLSSFETLIRKTMEKEYDNSSVFSLPCEVIKKAKELSSYQQFAQPHV